MSSPRRPPFTWRRGGAAAPVSSPRPAALDPGTWTGALVLITVFTGLIWVIQIVNAGDDQQLDRFGLRPRELGGLWGVVTMPLLHRDYHHLLSNTVALVAIGWVVLLAGVRVWTLVTATVVLGGGLLTWLVAPHGLIVGASGLVFGWLGYLLARAVFSRQLKWIVVAALVLAFFGTLLFGLLPSLHSTTSWQAHLCGFVAGVGSGALLHPRGGETRFVGRSAVS